MIICRTAKPKQFPYPPPYQNRPFLGKNTSFFIFYGTVRKLNQHQFSAKVSYSRNIQTLHGYSAFKFKSNLFSVIKLYACKSAAHIFNSQIDPFSFPKGERNPFYVEVFRGQLLLFRDRKCGFAFSFKITTSLSSFWSFWKVTAYLKSVLISIVPSCLDFISFFKPRQPPFRTAMVFANSSKLPVNTQNLA